MSLWRPPIPREHGSWVMAAVPLVAGAAVAGRWSWALVPFGLAVLSLLLLRGAVTILLTSGSRREGRNPGRLLLWTTIYGVTAALAGGLLIAVWEAWKLIWLGGLTAAVLGWDLHRLIQRRQLGLAGELIGSVAMAAAAPGAHYVITGVLDGTTVALWLVCALYFAARVFLVNMKIQWVRTPPTDLKTRLETGWMVLLAHLAALAVAGAAGSLGVAPTLIWGAFVPGTISALLAVFRGRRDTRFKRLGLTETGQALVFLALVVAVFAPHATGFVR